MSTPRRLLAPILVAVAGAALSHAQDVKPGTPAAALVAMKAFRPAEGLTIDLFAAEPMLGHPVAISPDGAGRIFVAETLPPGTGAPDLLRNPGPGGSRTLIRFLEDRDHDGKADFSAVYADNFGLVPDGTSLGLLARGGSVWLAQIPSLWRLDGLDKEGRAEKRAELSRGYGLRTGTAGHDLHGPIMGPDGRLYFSCGDRGADAKGGDGAALPKPLAVPHEGAVFRCEPDGSHLEIFCRGLREARGLAFDKFGNLFTADSGSGQGDSARLLYLVEDGDYGWRAGWQEHPQDRAHNPWLAEKLWMPAFEGQAAWLLPAVASLAGTPGALAYNPGTGLPQRYDDRFLCGFQGSQERSHISSWKAFRYLSGFLLQQEQVFVDHCPATDLAFGPDGGIYFTSARSEGGEAVERGRIFRISNALAGSEPELAEVRGLLAAGLAGKTPVELSPLLGHKDQRIRLGAQWELAAHPQGAAELAEAATTAPKDASDQQLARIHAIWGLGMLARRAESRTPGAAPKTLAPLITLLDDQDAEVRAQTARVLGENRVAEAFDGLIRTLRGEVGHVSFFSALALARLGNKEAVPQLLLVARSNGETDRFLRHACVVALAATNDFPALQEAAQHTDPQVRMVALLTLRRLGRPEIAQFLADEEPLLVIEAARAIHDVPIDAARPPLAALLARPGADGQLMLRVLNAAYGTGTAASARALAAFAAKDGTPDALRTEAVQLLALWPQPPARDRITGLPRPLPARDPAPAAAALRTLVENKDLPEKLRKEATAALAGFEK